MTETKQDQARVETAVKLDKKDFIDIPRPAMGAPVDAKVSPMAGKETTGQDMLFSRFFIAEH